MAKKYGKEYEYDPDNFVINRELGDFVLKGALKCPNKSNKKDVKVARNVWFYCKLNKKGKAVWGFKGDPRWVETKPNKIKCMSV